MKRVMDMRIIVIMGAMIIAMIKNQMGMRAIILEENMSKMVDIALMVRMEKKHLVESSMMMREHVRDLILTLRVNMVPMMMPEHVTHSTAMMKVR
ncbi:hypothetical protein RDI58_007327 [Solanum bulbocastanum]|uniref:Uncharacterized protein n=1 Tax=Solanum bulbocastanum TaxID=147425 RepID=A0AAN8TUP3_SOLBU